MNHPDGLTIAAAAAEDACASQAPHYPFQVIRRALAFFLFLVMALSCLTQGMAIVQCQITGQFYIGAGPGDCETCSGEDREVCEGGAGAACGDCCADKDSAADPEEQRYYARVLCAAECYVVMWRGAPPLPKVMGETGTLAPVRVAVVVPPYMGALPPQPLRQQESYKDLVRREGLPAPPGAARVVLYRSLQI